MEENYRKLKEVLEGLNLQLGLFYTATFTEYSISCQGRFKPETALALKNAGIVLTVDENGYLRGDDPESHIMFILSN